LVPAAPRLDQAALARGYPSQEAYEDAVVASARQLQRDGATVTLAPHLQHLAPRLGP
jgi:Tfp pilus assembly protein PilF